MTMVGERFNACDITSFLEISLGVYLGEIEECAIKMVDEDDKEARIELLDEIQYVIEACSRVLNIW